jgi:hypothetical protein
MITFCLVGLFGCATAIGLTKKVCDSVLSGSAAESVCGELEKLEAEAPAEETE